jgi:hypothetical protein
MQRKKAAIEMIHQKESTVEAGQSTIDEGSKSQFREFWLLRRVFSILVSVCFL